MYKGDICVGVELKDGKRSFSKIGAWFENSDGKLSIKIDFLPLVGRSDDGGFFAYLFEANAKKDAQESGPGIAVGVASAGYCTEDGVGYGGGGCIVPF